jgi:hypothetical protein
MSSIDILIHELADADIKLGFKGKDMLTVEAPAGTMTPELIAKIRTNKPALLRRLMAGQCDICPASSKWPGHFNGEDVCFHSAYFEHRAGEPKPVSVARKSCPLGTPMVGTLIHQAPADADGQGPEKPSD